LRIAPAFVLLASVAASGGTGLPHAAGASVERRLGAMGTWLSLRVEAVDRPTAVAASERAVAAIESAEARLSTWRATSELSHLNAAPAGHPVVLSPELARDLRFALEIAAETGGAFDPTVGPLVRCWGLRTGGRRPSPDELERATAACGFRFLELTGRVATRRHDAVTLEEGGFGKGVGLDDAIDALRTAGATSAFLDFGGQIASFGGSAHEVDLADPRDRSRAILRLRLSDGSIATSGNSERGAGAGAERIGHLLDPRTGHPANDFGSMTVRADSAALADALSTALFVLGPDDALRFARLHPEIDLVAIEMTPGGLRVRASRGLKDRIRALVPEISPTTEPN
jgi:thiamine biosynthesis lipoprotein